MKVNVPQLHGPPLGTHRSFSMEFSLPGLDIFYSDWKIKKEHLKQLKHMPILQTHSNRINPPPTSRSLSDPGVEECDSLCSLVGLTTVRHDGLWNWLKGTESL